MAKRKEKPLSQIILGLLLASFTIVFLILIALNYQSSYQAVKQETQHYFKQVDTLLHAVLNFELRTLGHRQDSSTAASAVHHALDDRDAVSLDNYFSAVDESSNKSTPDFRFIAIDNTVVWSDSNSFFLGLEKAELNRLAAEYLPNSAWLLRTVSTPLGENQILLRKAPIVAHSGKVTATLYIAVVLNDNTALVQQMQLASNSQAVMLVYQGHVIASSAGPEEPGDFTLNHDISQSPPIVPESLLLHETPIRLKWETPGIAFVTLHNNDNIVTLKYQFIQSALIGAALIVLLSIMAVYYFRKYTFVPLNQLVDYARNAITQNPLPPYPPGTISEFNRIGKAFENTLLQLSEKERSLDDLFNFAFSPILVWDSTLTLKHINPAAEKCLGADIANTQGLSHFDQFERDAKVYLQRALAGHIVKDIVLHTMDGRAFAWNMAPVIVNGKTNAVIAQGLDITMIKQAEQDSHRARQSAEEANREKSAFLATMSHEIRTPLNGILGMAQIIQQTLTDREQQQQMKVLYDSGNHLLTLLSDILDFSKIEQGKLELDKTDFQLGDLIRSISEIYLPLCAQKGLALEVCNMVDTPLQLHADDARIRQILFNLLSNAVKFTHSGAVTLTIERLAENEQNIKLRLAVSDTGIGIRKERLDKLFQPFVQAESSITRNYGGSGLGLSIVKQLVERMNGEISVDSTMGCGTTIAVLLPLDKSHTVLPPNPDEKQALPVIENLDILVAEDNKINALVAKTFCEKQGHRVQCVQNGQLAVEAVKNQDFDLILMDNHMPVMGGIEATRLIRHELQRDTVILACTADVFPQTRNDFIAAGANDVLVKPLKEESLLRALQQNLQGRKIHHRQQDNAELDNT